MSTQQSFIDFIIDQLRDSDRARYKKMFGEYVLYYDNKVVALCCNNKLFIKPTEDGKIYIEESGELVEDHPYPGSKKWYLIEDKIEDVEYLNELIKITAIELPEAKIKTKKIK